MEKSKNCYYLVQNDQTIIDPFDSRKSAQDYGKTKNFELFFSTVAEQKALESSQELHRYYTEAWMIWSRKGLIDIIGTFVIDEQSNYPINWLDK